MRMKLVKQGWKNWRARGASIPLSIAAIAFVLVFFFVFSFGFNLGTIAALLGTIILSAILIVDSAVVVLTANYGVVTRFKKRTGRVFDEGLAFVLPLIDRVDLVSYLLKTKDVKLTFFSFDDIEVIISGLVQWQPDRLVVDDKKRIKFVAIEERTITDGLDKTIKSVIGNLIGITQAVDVRTHKPAIERYLNCVLRLQMPPHVKPEENDKLNSSKPRWTQGNEVPREHRLAFYNENANLIENKLRTEEGKPKQHSDTENLYGIDIRAVKVDDVDYSEKTKRDLESRKQAEARMEGVKVETDTTLAISQRVKIQHPGIGDESAINAGLILSGKAPGSVIILQSPPGAGPIPVIPIQIPERKKEK